MSATLCRPLEAAQKMAREVVRDRRAADDKIDDAVAAAARLLGLTQRRVRALLYGEPVALRAAEFATITDRFAEHLARQEAQLHAQAALLNARRTALRNGLP